MSYLEKEQTLQDMVNQGQLLEAFDHYYHENVVMIEPNGQSTDGKVANRKREEAFLANVEAWHGGGVHKITSNETDQTTMTESWMDVSFKEGGKVKVEQVSVKQWEGENVIHERFYYNTASA